MSFFNTFPSNTHYHPAPTTSSSNTPHYHPYAPTSSTNNSQLPNELYANPHAHLYTSYVPEAPGASRASNGLVGRRQRVSVACTYCRRRKIRCCGSDICANCSRAGRKCEYAAVSDELITSTRERKARRVAPTASPSPISAPISSMAPAPSVMGYTPAPVYLESPAISPRAAETASMAGPPPAWVSSSSPSSSSSSSSYGAPSPPPAQQTQQAPFPSVLLGTPQTEAVSTFSSVQGYSAPSEGQAYSVGFNGSVTPIEYFSPMMSSSNNSKFSASAYPPTTPTRRPKLSALQPFSAYSNLATPPATPSLGYFQPSTPTFHPSAYPLSAPTTPMLPSSGFFASSSAMDAPPCWSSSAVYAEGGLNIMMPQVGGGMGNMFGGEEVYYQY